MILGIEDDEAEQPVEDDGEDAEKTEGEDDTAAAAAILTEINTK